MGINETLSRVHILVQTKEEADSVVTCLTEIVERYGNATLADLHDLVGLPSYHKHHKRAWTKIEDVKIDQKENGYLIDLPPTQEI
jgi:hypothetical protein